MALGDIRNNSGKSNKMYESTYYSRMSFKSQDSKLRLGFSFKSGMVIVDISEEKDGFQYETLTSCYLTPTKANLLFNQIQKFKNDVENGSYKTDAGYGVNTGMGDISTVIMVHLLGKDTAITIAKVNVDGQYVSKYTYKFNKGYHYGITLKNYEDMSSYQKEFYDEIEFEQFQNILKSFSDNMNGSIGYSVIDLARYDYRGMMNKMNPIYDKLGIERGNSNSTRPSDNNFFNGGGFNKGTSTSTSLDDVMSDLPIEED